MPIYFDEKQSNQIYKNRQNERKIYPYFLYHSSDCLLSPCWDMKTERAKLKSKETHHIKYHEENIHKFKL